MESGALSAVTGSLLYAMLGFPFLVWGGQAAYRSARKHEGRFPDLLPALFFLVLPLVFLGFQFLPSSGPAEPRSLPSLLLLPPALGLIAGYAGGMLLGLNAKRSTHSMTKPFTIAIDGPAASGKGTLARRLAAQYGFHHLDTGLTYRAVAKAMLAAGLPLDDEAIAEQTALMLDLSKLDRAVLSTHDIGEAASKVAVMPAVRRALVTAQRNFAETPPGTVLDGRDIGTVVCPDAPVKLYVTASPDARAIRRYKEMVSKGQTADLGGVLEDIKRRDARDMGRSDSPLRPAEDAHLLDTTEMDIETAFQTAKNLIDRALAAGK